MYHSLISFCPIKNVSAPDKEVKGDKELKHEDKSMRNDKSMKPIIVDMFNCDLNITDIESNIFSSPIKLKLVIDFVDLSFSILDK